MPTCQTEKMGLKRTYDSIVEQPFQGELSVNEFTSFSCCASEIASNDVAYVAAADEAATARGEAMTVQAETVTRGAECVTTEVNTCIRYGPAPEVAGRRLVADETEQCHARAKCTEIMEVTSQRHKSDYNNATTFYQQFPATGDFGLYKTDYSHHETLHKPHHFHKIGTINIHCRSTRKKNSNSGSQTQTDATEGPSRQVQLYTTPSAIQMLATSDSAGTRIPDPIYQCRNRK